MTLVTGKALNFNGVNADVDFGHDAKFDLTAAGTIELCMKKEANIAAYGIVAGKTGADYLYYLYIDRDYGGGGINHTVFGLKDAGGYKIIDLGNLTDGVAYHIVCTWDSSYLRAFVDASPITPVAAAACISAAADDFSIGGPTGARWYKGDIDELRLYGRALGQAEVTVNYNGGDILCDPSDHSNLILWVPFLRGIGTTAYDKSGNGLDGTISNATWTNGIVKHTGAVWDFFTWG